MSTETDAIQITALDGPAPFTNGDRRVWWGYRIEVPGSAAFDYWICNPRHAYDEDGWTLEYDDEALSDGSNPAELEDPHVDEWWDDLVDAVEEDLRNTY